LDNFKAGIIKTFPIVAKKLSHQNHCPERLYRHLG